MNLRPLIAFLAFLSCLTLITPAQADIWVARGSGESGVFPNNAISVFADPADGDVAPSLVLGGDRSGLQSVADIDLDAVHSQLLMADFRAGNIKRFPIEAAGNVAPQSFFWSGGMGQPRNVAAMPAVNEIAVLTGLCCISYYAFDASGLVSPLRQTARSGTGLDNPSGLAFLPQTDEMVIGDYESIEGGTRGEVMFFSRLGNGAVTPTRRLAGANTRLGRYILDVAVDLPRQELLVLAGDALVEGVAPARILVFALGASGEVTPLREIAGPSTRLVSASRLALDTRHDEILVTVGFSNSSPAILGFDRLATGNASPRRDIRGAATGVTGNIGFGGVIALDRDGLFASGFDP